jgi:hypothetical protein
MAGHPEINPDKLLNRAATAEALQALGFPVAAKSLATRATPRKPPDMQRPRTPGAGVTRAVRNSLGSNSSHRIRRPAPAVQRLCEVRHGTR